MGKAHSKLNPEAVSALQKSTHFDKKEIQVWYQAFLRDCPTGLLSKERFLQMYDNFFPFGDSTAFAGHMFRVYTTHFDGLESFGGLVGTTRPSSMTEVDLSIEGNGERQLARSHKRESVKASSDQLRAGDGRGPSPAPSSGRNAITFEQYLQTLSIIARGRAEEKLRLAFTLYDHDGDGLISHADMTIVVDAIYRMVGAIVEFAPDEEAPRQRVDKMFALFNKRADERITFEEFQEGLQADPVAIKNLLLYDGTV